MQKFVTLHIWRLLGLVAVTALPALAFAPPAHAMNNAVEEALQSSGDVSMFYQALLNTGILGELVEDEHYTVFAPTNESWQQISPRVYPCFYQVQCRPQIAALFRNYIVVGDRSLNDLATTDFGVPTEGTHLIHVAQDYPGDFSVEGKKILSQNSIDGNTVYRIDGVIAQPADLYPFRTAGNEAAERVATAEPATQELNGMLRSNDTQTIIVYR